MATLYQLHVDRWKGGCGSSICERARNVCYVRGDIPCDVALVGEAPGESENIMGRPFVGPAGQLLDYIVGRASRMVQHPEGRPFRFAFSNLVGCIPYDDDPELDGKKRKATEPSVESIMECQPRLSELLGILQPTLLVCVGALAREWCKQGFKHSLKLPASVVSSIDIAHPAALLRLNAASRGFAVQQAWVRIKNALEDEALWNKE